MTQISTQIQKPEEQFSSPSESDPHPPLILIIKFDNTLNVQILTTIVRKPAQTTRSYAHVHKGRVHNAFIQQIVCFL